MITPVGPHRVCCASVDSPEVDELLDGKRVEVIYTNPPWDDRIVANWANLRLRQTGEPPPPVTFDGLIGRILDLAERHLDGWLIMEMGKDTSWSVAERAAEDFPRVRVYHNEKNDIIAAGDTPYPVDLTGLADRALEHEAIAAVAKPGSVVFDPCCGYGLTAHAALANGMVFYGCEFNRNRLYHAIRFLERQQGC